MSSNDPVPSADEIIGPGVASLIASRPASMPFVNYGVGNYAKVFAGWRAQVILLLRRLADECKSKRLALAEGDALLDLVTSEFGTPATFSATQAVGEVILTRSIYTANKQGVIRKGHRFRRNGDPAAQPLALQDMTYEVTQDCVLRGHIVGRLDDSGWPMFGPLIKIPIIAQKAGKAGNLTKGTTVPNYNQLTANVDGLTLTSADTLFDSNIVISDYFASGGMDGVRSDPVIRRLATALVAGRGSPTLLALLAGAYSTPGVTRCTPLENPRTGRTVIFATDDTWSFSTTFATSVVQKLKSDWVGFGCSVQPGQIQNQFVHVIPTVYLTNSRWLTNTTEIDLAIQKAVVAYFDERPDWYTWTMAGLRGAIARAHRKIRTCTNVFVKDAVTGLDVTVPGALVLTDAVSPFPILTHTYVPDGAVLFSYLAPI